MYRLSMENPSSSSERTDERKPSSTKSSKRERRNSSSSMKAPRLIRHTSEVERWRLVKELQGSSFNGRQKLDFEDGATVTSNRSTKSWWQRGQMGRADDSNSVKTKSPKRSIFFSLFSKEKKSIVAVSGKKNEQIVDDFFDVQSVVSAPSTPNSRMFGYDDDVLETRSVTSVRSFAGFTFGYRVPEGPKVDDEITLDPVELFRSQSLVVDNVSPLASPQLKRRSSFLSRLTSRRPMMSVPDISATVPVDIQDTAKGDRNSVTESDDSFDEEIMASSSSEDGDPVFITEVEDLSPIKQEISRKSPIDRWSPICVPVTAPEQDAPKQPIRRIETENGTIYEEDSESEGVADEESKEQITDYLKDDDEESVLSLLSGLLASWVAQRDQEKSSSGTIDFLPASPKGCLKKCFPVLTDSSKPKLTVTFDRIQVRQYERVVGDNPSCTSGPPIALGWDYIWVENYRVDDYEMQKPYKRTKREFYLPAGKRNDLLTQEWQFTAEDIRKARREATYVQYCREKSAFAGRTAARKEAAFLRRAATARAVPDDSDTSKPPMLRHRNSMEAYPAPYHPTRRTRRGSAGSPRNFHRYHQPPSNVQGYHQPTPLRSSQSLPNVYPPIYSVATANIRPDPLYGAHPVSLQRHVSYHQPPASPRRGREYRASTYTSRRYPSHH